MQPPNQATGQSRHAQAHTNGRAAIFLALTATLLACALISSAAQALVLPDNRHYEEVTPVHMNGARAEPVFSSQDGEDVFYDATAPFAGSSGGADTSPYGAQRTSTGWQSTQLLPPAGEHFDGKLIGGPVDDFSPLGFGKSLISLSNPFDSIAGLYTKNNIALYIQESGGAGGLAPASEVNTTPQSGVGGNADSAYYYGGSVDLTHLFYINEPISVNETAAPYQLFEDYQTGGGWHYRYVAVEGPNNPDGSGKMIDGCGSVLGSGGLANGGTGPGTPVSAAVHTLFHAVSPDGSTVFFTAVRCRKEFGVVQEPGVNELFARVNGATTVPISEPAVSTCSTANFFEHPTPSFCADAQFEGASKDGSKVFFTTTQAEVSGVTDSTKNLYEAEIDGSSVTRMTQVSTGDAGGEGARVQGVVRISDDGSHVYFVAQGALTNVPGPEGQTAQSGADNLYVNDAGTTSFIGDLCSGLDMSGLVADARCPSSSQDHLWNFEPSVGAGNEDSDVHSAWAAPFGSTDSNGQFLVFQSYARLTSDDTDTARDVYEYDSQTGSLVRISKGRGGFDNDGNNNAFDANLPTVSNSVRGAAADGELQTGVGGEEYGDGRPVSNDGSYVFFTTSEALEPDDVNNAPDVYEWHDGLVSLISDGQNLGTRLGGNSGTANGFIATSASGRDVFIVTPDVLVPGGGVSIAGIYDARIGGGFSVANVPPPCQEDACQGAISATPSFAAPTSATYSSGEGGNATATSPTVKAKPKKKAKAKKRPKAKRPNKKATHKKNTRAAKGGK